MVYADDIAGVLEDIKADGQPVTWRQLPDGAPVAGKPWKPVASIPVNHQVDILFLPVGRWTSKFSQEIGEVPIGTEYGLMGAVDFEPSIKDIVIRNGKEYRVESFDRLAPNGEVILYTVWYWK